MILRVYLCPLQELAEDSVLDFETWGPKRQLLGQGSARARQMPLSRRTEIVVAAPDVLLLSRAVPSLSSARLKAALPGLAEEVLLGDTERAFVVATPRDGEGQAGIGIIDREQWRAALALLRRAGLKPASATAEPYTQRANPALWTVRSRQRYCSVRTGRYSGFAASPLNVEEPPPELILALRQAALPPQVIEVDGAIHVEAWCRCLGDVSVTCVSPMLREAPPAALDLLQYEFSNAALDLRAWRPALWAAAGLLLVSALGLNLHTWRLYQEARQIRTELNGMLTQAFPEVLTVLDPVLQMRQGVARLRGGSGISSPSDFFPRAQALASIVENHGPIKSLDYANGVLRAELATAPDGASNAKETMLTRARQAGVAIEIDGTHVVIRPMVTP